MIYCVSSTACLYVLVEAEGEQNVRELGTAALEQLHAQRFAKYNVAVPVELVCVRQAEEHEIALAEYQERCEAQERLAESR